MLYQYRQSPTAASAAPPTRSQTRARAIELSDGTQLVEGARVGPVALHINDWIKVHDEHRRITDMRAQPRNGGRIIHLEGGGPPYLMTSSDAVVRYTVVPPASPRTSS